MQVTFPQVPLDDEYEIIKYLSYGASCKVYKVRDRYGFYHAAKIFKKGEYFSKEWKNEVGIFLTLQRHERIINFTAAGFGKVEKKKPGKDEREILVRKREFAR